MMPQKTSTGPTYKVRLVLKEGEQLLITPLDKKVAKVEFTPVAEETTPSNEISSGDYIVGRDVDAGKYRLSSPQLNNKKFDKVEWQVWVYNNRYRNQRWIEIDAQKKPEITLHQGEVITSSYEAFMTEDPRNKRNSF